jgi:hypothetical protein
MDYLLQRQIQGDHIQARLRFGIPEIGWDGDPFLSLYLNKLSDTWEVWDEIGDEPKLLCRRPAAIGRVEDAVITLCANLRDHDFRKHKPEDIVDRVVQKNEILKREKDRVHSEKRMEASDRIRHALRKDLGHLV